MKARLYKYTHTLRKHAYSNILKILPPKTENFQMKSSDTFQISAQSIDCGYTLEPPRRGGSNEYPKSMFLSRNQKNKVYPCKPQFYYIQVGFMGVKIISACFRDVNTFHAASMCIDWQVALARWVKFHLTAFWNNFFFFFFFFFSWK